MFNYKDKMQNNKMVIISIIIIIIKLSYLQLNYVFSDIYNLIPMQSSYNEMKYDIVHY